MEVPLLFYFELRSYFGWEVALREALEAAEEAVNHAPPRGDLPLINDEEYAAFRKEWSTCNGSEIVKILEKWPRSFTLIQRAELLGVMQSDDKVNREPMRATVREKMQIHDSSRERR